MRCLYLARIRSGRMQERPAGPACPIDELFGEGLEVVAIVVIFFADDVDQARPSAPQADHPVALPQRPDSDRTDRRVQPRHVTTACEDSDYAFCCIDVGHATSFSLSIHYIT